MANSFIRALDRHVEQARESVLAALNRATARKRSDELKSQNEASGQSRRLALLEVIDQQVSLLPAESETQPRG